MVLELDMVDQYLIFAFAMLAQAQTPGTWTAVECMGLDRRAPSGSLRPTGGGMGSGYVAPSQALMPTVVKWLLQFEDYEQTPVSNDVKKDTLLQILPKTFESAIKDAMMHFEKDDTEMDYDFVKKLVLQRVDREAGPEVDEDAMDVDLVREKEPGYGVGREHRQPGASASTRTTGQEREG